MSSLATIQVGSIRTIRQDENHNAFTDLCWYGGRFYLAFRSCPEGHAVALSRIVILSSEDGENWTETFSFAVPGRDPRDPHFLEFKGTLFVYTGTWLLPEEGQPLNLNDNVGYGAWTDDGANWSGPHLLEGTYGHFIWRAAGHGDCAYLCARRRRSFQAGIESEQEPLTIESAMLESDDGTVWRFRAFFAEDCGDETAFLFEDDGSILAIARDGDGKRARVCRSFPPWEAWTRTPLDRNVGGPMIVRWGRRYLVGGRKSNAVGGPSMALSWLVDDQLIEVVALPSGGDCSYPGFVELDDEHALLSYYSSHEGRTSIYITELSLMAGENHSGLFGS